MHAPLTLLCLPCAGASATMYLRWRRLLPHWIRIAPVELPGRGSRLGEPAVEDFGQLVSLLCAEQRQAMRGRFALLGHSMGALLAFGMARHLREEGRELPLALVASGSPAPACRDPERFAGKGDDAALIADLRRQGGTPEEVFGSTELMRITLDVLGSDYRVCESFGHVPAAGLPLPVHVFAGRQDDIEAPRVQAWSQEAAGAFTLDWFEGGHFFIRQREGDVLAVLAQRLAGSQSLQGEIHAARVRA
ncbi:thioesterase II family protein [Delftia sp. HK171]|uniref:thioesterase II family protein n=1 Tax=Delftia sp. HK171 TaxID=1920191 RepID=UPI00114DD82B|nr:alpha/beta fold hydrolase [Delftia sp. HK171]TQL65114.1 surfactin synthase thioesterase subunit [Delftia sp. HK171]